MALVDLKTDLKSLKFDSGLNRKPFVVKDVDQEGGPNNAIQTQGILAAKRIDDVVRMAKLVIAKPGLTHAAKQVLTGFISAADKKTIYDGSKLGRELIDQAKDIVLTAVTNVAQTPLNGLGLHMFKGQLEKADKRDYTKVVKPNNGIKNNNLSTEFSQGIKKSKKYKLAGEAKQQYGRIDYLTPTTETAKLADQVTGVKINKEGVTGDDIIPFYFQILGEEKDTYNTVQFRAYLNALSDSYNGQWNKTSYLGRPESFMTYNGFERSISLGFIIAAENRLDLKPMYQKLNYLASTTAPTFDESGLFMRGTLVKLTVGDYFSKQLCAINNVSISWDVNYPWEIKLNENEEKDVQILPHILNVSLTADAIHEFVPQTGQISKSPFFTNITKDAIEDHFTP